MELTSGMTCSPRIRTCSLRSGKPSTSIPAHALNVNGFSGAFQNYYDSAADWGPAGYDVRNNLTAIGVYELPVGQGKQFLSGANRWVNGVIGNWQLSTAIVLYSGFPQTTTGPGNNSQSYGTSRPNQYRPLKIRDRTITTGLATIHRRRHA